MGRHSSHVVSHSSGEIAAAYAAGIVSFQTAMAIAYFRGLAAAKVLRDQSLQGAMLAVGASAEEAQRLRLAVAAMLLLLQSTAPPL